jgi:hypothetical protein
MFDAGAAIPSVAAEQTRRSPATKNGDLEKESLRQLPFFLRRLSISGCAVCRWVEESRTSARLDWAPGGVTTSEKENVMTQYLLSVNGVDGQEPPAERIPAIHAAVDEFNKELQAAGAWVFAGGLEPPHTATVVRIEGAESVLTDGPFAESKEHIGGFWIIEAPDLDAALRWAEGGARACENPVEVRPFQPIPEG